MTRAGAAIELTATEYRLLRYLMLNPRRVLTRAQLLDHVWNYDFGGDGRVLETYISYLRKKLDVARTVADQDGARRRLRACRRRAPDVLAARARARERARCSPPPDWSRSAPSRTPSSARSCRDGSTSRSSAAGPGALAGARQRWLPAERQHRRTEPGGRQTERRRRAAGQALAGGPRAAVREPQPAARAPTASAATASGKVLGTRTDQLRSSRPPAPPKIPAHVPVGKLFTVGSVGSSGLRYRVYVQHDPEDSGHDGRRRCRCAKSTRRSAGCCSSRALVIVGVLLALGAERVLRRPTRAAPARPHRGHGRRDRRRASSPGASARRRRRTEVGRLGLALNAMLERLEQAFAARTASEERLRQFLADASHELRTPLASIRGYAELFRMGATRDAAEHRDGDAPHRGGVRAHGRARRGPADARAPRRGARSLSRRPVELVGARARRGRRTPARLRRERAITLARRAARRGLGRPACSCARCSPTCCATRSCTRRRARRSR